MAQPSTTASAPSRKPSKSKSVQLITETDWRCLLSPGSETLQIILENEARSDDFLVQLGASLRSGALANSSQALRIDILGLFERHCVQLCRGPDNLNRLRMIYETLRDNLGSATRDGPQAAAKLRDTALRSLTQCLIALDIPSRDPRLAKFHIELLLRFLDTGVPPAAKRSSATQDAMQDRRLLAAECLRLLEAAFPTLLFQEAAALLDLSAKEVIEPTPGFVRTQLAATVLSNLSAMYMRQQEEEGNFGPPADSAPVFKIDEEEEEEKEEVIGAENSFGTSSEGSGTGEVLQMAADALCDPKFAHGPTSLSLDSESDGEEETSPVPPVAGEKGRDQQTSSGFSGSSQAVASLLPRLKLGLEAANATSATNSGSGSSSPSGVVSAAAAPSLASKQSSRRSMLASVIESQEACEDDKASTASSLPRSALTAALRTTSGGSQDGASAGWHKTLSAASTPRCGRAGSDVPLLQTTAASLRRFTVPQHLQTGDVEDEPRLVMTPDAQEALQRAVTSLLGFMRRLDPGAVAVVARALPPLLRASRPSPTQLWPYFERHLSAGSLSLLRAVLDIHDEMPALFEGRGPCLVEKVLSQANDPSLSADHRVAAVSWVTRQHAAQCHVGGALLLADCWEKLLPRNREPPQLASLKVKALAACLSSGIGDEEIVCRSVCSWEGYGGVRPTDQQIRAFTYALRFLHAAAPPDGPSAHRSRACLVTGILEALVARPQLVPAVAAFLKNCSPEFTVVFLRALDALLCSVEGQFEVLRERPEDAAFEGTPLELDSRVKAAMISRSSSLSGLMRGLSFKLSFTKRTHSVLPSINSARGTGTKSGNGIGAPVSRLVSVAESTLERPLDVRALRSSISSAFQQRAEQQSNTQATPLPLRRSVTAPPPAQGGAITRPGPGGIERTASIRSANGSQHSMAAASDINENDEENSAFGDSSTPPPPAVAPPVPMDLPSAEAVESWLSSPSTWECLAPGILQQDLMAYRTLMQSVLRNVDVHPRGTLRTLATYTWQYKESHPSHTLPAKESAAAILGLCHTAALEHLPCPHSDGWSLRQSEVAEAVLAVLDALEEGFPVPAARARSKILSNLLANEAAWGAGAKGATLHKIIRGYVDAAVEG